MLEQKFYFSKDIRKMLNSQCIQLLNKYDKFSSFTIKYSQTTEEVFTKHNIVWSYVKDIICS